MSDENASHPLTEALKTRLLPAALAALASSYLFTIGVFDALGIGYSPNFKDAALFVFRITFLSFVKGMLESWDIWLLVLMWIYFLYLCLSSFKFEKPTDRNLNITALIFALLSFITLVFRASFTFNERSILLLATAMVTAAPFLGIMIVEFFSSKIYNALKLTCVFGALVFIAGSYFVGIKALQKNIRFPMIQKDLIDHNSWLKVWESESDLYLIKCATQKSIQVWRWTDEGYKLLQFLVSDGTNSLDDICTRSTK